MDKLLVLFDLQKQAQKAATVNDYAFFIVNHTQKIISYKQAVFWRLESGHIRLESVSGNAVLDQNGLYALEVKKHLQETLKSVSDEQYTHTISASNATPEAQKTWGDLFAPSVTVALLKTQKEGCIGGLWLERDKPLTQAENDLFKEMLESYAYSLAALLKTGKKLSVLSFFSQKKTRLYGLIAVTIAFFFPAQLSITAPAEIVAKSPKIVSIPYDGVIEDILVKPGETVETGQVVALMDQTTIKAQADQARQVLQTAQVTLSKAGLESLRDADKKADLQVLKSEIAEKRIELNYAQEQLGRTQIKAPTSGVAIFADANSLEGKPMHTGEKIMMVANPKESELLIKVPIDTLLPMTKDSHTSFYLNVAPLKGHSADIISIGYQASPDTDGLLTYKIRANIKDANEEDLRIGWKGTAKIKSSWSILGYAVLRKPLIALRNLTGL